MPSGSSGACSAIAPILNKRGLHARAAAKFVKTAGAFEAEIEVSRAGQTVSGLSIMGLMMLAAATGSEIEIRCTGEDAGRALEALLSLISDKFDED